MKDKVMGPFRAPREAVDRLRSSVLTDKPDSTAKDNTDLESDSEEATELGLVYGPWIIKETQEDEPQAMVDHYSDMGTHLVRNIQPSCSNVHVTSSELPSPSLSEFESYLGARESESKTIEAQSKKNVELRTMNEAGDGSNSLSVPYQRPENVSND
jgi:hypothetical protein